MACMHVVASGPVSGWYALTILDTHTPCGVFSRALRCRSQRKAVAWLQGPGMSGVAFAGAKFLGGSLEASIWSATAAALGVLKRVERRPGSQEEGEGGAAAR